MSGLLIGYARVSTDAQDLAAQRDALAGLGVQPERTFDLGDDWTHLCTVGPSRIDPAEALGIVPDSPLPYWGWGAIPDQYGREFDGDDGETYLEDDPELTDLPPLRPPLGQTAPIVTPSPAADLATLHFSQLRESWAR